MKNLRRKVILASFLGTIGVVSLLLDAIFVTEDSQFRILRTVLVLTMFGFSGGFISGYWYCGYLKRRYAAEEQELTDDGEKERGVKRVLIARGKITRRRRH